MMSHDHMREASKTEDIKWEGNETKIYLPQNGLPIRFER